MIEFLQTKYFDYPKIDQRADGKTELFFQTEQFIGKLPSAVQIFLDSPENTDPASIVVLAKPFFQGRVYLLTKTETTKLMEIREEEVVESKAGNIPNIEEILRGIKRTHTRAFQDPEGLVYVSVQTNRSFNLRDYDFWLPGKVYTRIRLVADSDPSEGFEKQVRLRFIIGQGFNNKVTEGLRAVQKDGIWLPMQPRVRQSVTSLTI